ncbi:hypothetical protein MKAN_12595 [Mycobacterium kansasii ATCC 12478]|uniref:Uncharacterized protein n=1 Tax=Mycobacterium kansasii ATCC 12478 TaxID=557599 RepID=U5WYB4_MYCKA|nr:hypothetical protein MKAN_12595 [Mycobacterium kansasii ATCC 12478]
MPGAPSAPLPINGRPNNARVGALIALSSCCPALVTSVIA